MIWYVIIAIILLSWIIALFFEDFREIIMDDWIFLDFSLSESYKQDKEKKGSFRTFVMLILTLVAILFLFILVIVFLPIIWIIFESADEIQYYIELRKRGYTPKTWEEELERRRQEQKELDEWRDSRIKRFHYPGEVPFSFDRDTYLYLENKYDEEINACIERNLSIIENVFKEYNSRFIYLPRWKPDTEIIRKTYLEEKTIVKINDFLNRITTVEYTKLLCRSLKIDFSEIETGIFHFACYMYDESKLPAKIIEKTRFTHFLMKGVDDDNIEVFFRKYCEMIKDGRNSPQGCCMSVVSKWKGWDLSERIGIFPQDYADYTFPNDMNEIAENVKNEIEKLKEGGYYELLLHTLGSETINELRHVKLNPSLSRLLITDDYRLFLTDYDVEVKLTPLQKTLYVFYLRHPEGVEFKMLSAYYDELLAIYKLLSNRESIEKLELSIRRLVDVTDNAINEKCSRIKEAFLKVSDDLIAKNYYIVLKTEYCKDENYIYSNLLKQIVLPRELVSYPKEIERIKVLEPIEKKKLIKDKKRYYEEQYGLLKTRFFDKQYPKGQLIEEYTSYLNENPKQYRAYMERAILYTHVGRYKEAIADNDKLIEHNEWLWMEAVINKAEALYFMKEYGLALKTANHFFEINDNPNSESYRIRSEIFKKLKMYEEYEADVKMMKTLEKKEKKKF